MKQKLVQYVSLFDANKIVTASNKLPSETQYIKAQMRGRTFKSVEEKESFLRKMAHETRCECHHFTNPIPMSERGQPDNQAGQFASTETAATTRKTIPKHS